MKEATFFSSAIKNINKRGEQRGTATLLQMKKAIEEANWSAFMVDNLIANSSANFVYFLRLVTVILYCEWINYPYCGLWCFDASKPPIY